MFHFLLPLSLALFVVRSFGFKLLSFSSPFSFGRLDFVTRADEAPQVKEIFWWKHAAACHQGSTIPGEDGCFVEDDVWAALSEAS